jgi:hypothetical protein
VALDSELSLMRMKHCPLQFMVRFSPIKGFLDTLPHGQALPFCGDSQKYPSSGRFLKKQRAFTALQRRSAQMPGCPSSICSHMPLWYGSWQALFD